MLRDYTRIRTYGHERIQQNEQRTCGNQILSASHLTRRSRATPPRTEAAALTTLAKHGAATSAASCRAAMLLLVLVGVACRRQARGDEPRAERARHGRHCRRRVCGAAPAHRLLDPGHPTGPHGALGFNGTGTKARASPGTGAGANNPEHDEMRGAAGRCIVAEETNEAGEWSTRRRCVDLTRRGGGGSRASEGRGREPPLAVPSARREEWRDGDDWRREGVGGV